MTEGERLSLFRRRGYLCEICRKEKATDLHHCLFRRDKRKPELNHEINYECLCHGCHMQGLGDTFDHRCAFYIRQVERYGYDVVMAWLESLPLKLKKFEFTRGKVTPLEAGGLSVFPPPVVPEMGNSSILHRRKPRRLRSQFPQP